VPDGKLGHADDVLPGDVSESACRSVAQSMTASQHARNGEADMDVEIAVGENGALEDFIERLLAHDGEDVDWIIEEIHQITPEFDEEYGTYALATQADEAKRARCSMLSIIWLLTDRYDKFTEGQPEDNRLTKEQWEALRSLVLRVGSSQAKVGALLVFLAIRGIGKSKAVVNLLPEAHHTPEQAVLYIIRNGRRLVPSFYALSNEMQALIKDSLVVHDTFNFGQMLQGENLPSHVQDLRTCVDQYGVDILEFYLATMLGMFCGILGAKRNHAALFMDCKKAANVTRGIHCLQCLVTSTPCAIYWTYVAGYGRALNLPLDTVEHMALARFACLLRATKDSDCAIMHGTWEKLNRHDKSVLIDNFLADGIEQPALFFLFLPTYFDNARKNPVIGLHRALIVLIDLIELFQQGALGNAPTMKVDLSVLCSLARDALDTSAFELFVERLSVEFREGEVKFEYRSGQVDEKMAKLDAVTREVKHLHRELFSYRPAGGPNPSKSKQSI
jgi:hypothetical protein